MNIYHHFSLNQHIAELLNVVAGYIKATMSLPAVKRVLNHAIARYALYTEALPEFQLNKEYNSFQNTFVINLVCRLLDFAKAALVVIDIYMDDLRFSNDLYYLYRTSDLTKNSISYMAEVKPKKGLVS